MKSKNRLISALVAATMMATTAPALKKKKKEEDNGFALYAQETVFTPLTLNEYEEGVKNSYKYLSKFINYDTFQRDLQCLYYLINRSYLLEADEQTMIAAGYVFNTDIAHGEFENFFRAYNLINVIADYNQSVIRKVNSLSDAYAKMISYESYDKELFNSYLTKVVNIPSYTLDDAIVEYNNEVSKKHPEL